MDKIFRSISNEILRFLDENPSNEMGGTLGDEKIWDKPLLGVAAGDDPIFKSFRDKVDALHWTPLEAFIAGGYSTDSESEISVISWVLPHTEITKRDNAQEKNMPSERWARSRINGEGANMKLRQNIVSFLTEKGYQAVSPMLLKDWTQMNSTRYTYTSNWSERHIAHACGLGTFGLCDGLITPLGKAVRLGSIVVKARLTPNPRPYSRFDEYCPFKTRHACGACIKRCPVGALSENGHDKKLCEKFLHEHAQEYVGTHYGLTGYGCGLCQTGVPCASQIPEGPLVF